MTDQPRLQHVLDEFVAGRDAPGATAAAVYGHGETWAGAAGVADPDTSRVMTPDTQMAIGSMTKSLVAALALRLTERGDLALEHPIAGYLPPKADTRGATVEEVLAHRSGIPEHVTPRFVAALLDEPSRAWTTAEVLRYQEDTAGPRGEYSYSSTNYILLGLAIEQVTGAPLASAMNKLLLAPLGLDRIVYQGGERPPEPVAIGLTHLAGPTPIAIRDASGLLPCRALATAAGAAGGMAADVESLARWAHLLYRGGVLGPDCLRLITQSDGHGFGSASFEVGGDGAYGHPGRIPGYRGMFAHLPSLDVSCAVLINTDADAAEPAELLARLLGVIRAQSGDLRQ